MQHILSPALLSALSGSVAVRLGLHFPEERWGDMERGVGAVAQELGFPDAEACAHWLLSANATAERIGVLASRLTVGETYFFREPASLEIIAQHIVPELLRQRDGKRPVHIWSAGCCTGEEPYSIAIELDRMFPRAEADAVSILATDINPRFLLQAERGLYGDWSFRGVPAWIRARYFERSKGGRWALAPRIRSKVSFSCLNLAKDDYRSALKSAHGMDVILCRNVLMYFTAEQARRTVRALYRSLAAGGWLIVGAVETSNTLFSSFSAVQFPGALIYRKDPNAAVRAAAPSAAMSAAVGPLDPLPIPLRADAVPFGARAQQANPPAAVSGVRDEALRAEAERAAVTARRCADEGKLAAAAEWCEQAIGADKLNPARHYLLATIRQEQGDMGECIASLTRALYLDPDFALAHFALGNIELARGRRSEADRHFTNALASLRARRDDEVLAESDGLSVGQLSAIVSSLCTQLADAAARA